MVAMSERIRALEDALKRECLARRAPHPGGTTDTQEKAGIKTRCELEVEEEKAEQERIGSYAQDYSDTIHPLLTPTLLEIKYGVDALAIAADEIQNADESIRNEIDSNSTASEMISAFGTLSISDGRSMRFLGTSATEVGLFYIKYLFIMIIDERLSIRC